MQRIFMKISGVTSSVTAKKTSFSEKSFGKEMRRKKQTHYRLRVDKNKNRLLQNLFDYEGNK